MADMRILLLALALTGCAAQPQKVEITYELDEFGALFPIVNGEEFRPTDAERHRQVQQLVNSYCPAQ